MGKVSRVGKNRVGTLRRLWMERKPKTNSVQKPRASDADKQTITVQIPMRPSGVMLGDDCWLKWKRHPLTPLNDRA